MSNIEISYIWDRKSYIKATKIAYEYELQKSPKRFLGWIFIAMSQFGVVALIKRGTVGLLLLSIILLLYWYYFRWWIRKSLLLKNFKNAPNRDQKFHVVADEHGLKLNGTIIDWSSISEVISLKGGFLLYYSGTFLFLPTSGFRNMEEKNRFAILAKSRVPNYKKG
jgi:hypothetical protein